MGQFTLASFEKSCFLFGRFETLRTPLFHELLAAAAEQFTDAMDLSIDEVVRKQLSIHDQFVQKVQLLLFWLLAYVLLLDALSYELFHLLLAELQCTRS